MELCRARPTLDSVEVHLFSSGELLDELLLEHGDLEVQRVGRARYVARFREGSGSIEVAFWTTEKGRIQVKEWGERPSWLRLEVAEDLALERTEAVRVDVHVEHMDRGPTSSA